MSFRASDKVSRPDENGSGLATDPRGERSDERTGLKRQILGEICDNKRSTKHVHGEKEEEAAAPWRGFCHGPDRDSTKPVEFPKENSRVESFSSTAASERPLGQTEGDDAKKRKNKLLGTLDDGGDEGVAEASKKKKKKRKEKEMDAELSVVGNEEEVLKKGRVGERWSEAEDSI